MDIVPLKRVITANDEDGKSFATVDDPTRGAYQQGVRPVALTDLWRMTSMPPVVNGGNDKSEQFQLAPPAGGLVFRVVQFDAGANDVEIDASTIFAEMGAEGAHAGNTQSPYMHRTHSVDFGIILKGHITMVLDSEEYELSQGDVVIQRATNHEWRNAGTEPCLVAFILVAGR